MCSANCVCFLISSIELELINLIGVSRNLVICLFICVFNSIISYKYYANIKLYDDCLIVFHLCIFIIMMIYSIIYRDQKFADELQPLSENFWWFKSNVYKFYVYLAKYLAKHMKWNVINDKWLTKQPSLLSNFLMHPTLYILLEIMRIYVTVNFA